VQQLVARLDGARPGSAVAIQAALEDHTAPERLIEATLGAFQRLDVLVNNASQYRSTPLGAITRSDWDGMLAVNLAAPMFLAQAAAPWLRRTCGAIVNIVDVYGERPRRGYPVYSISKAGLIMLTRSLAVDLAPEVRVNAIAPGAILWPEQGVVDREQVLAATPMRRLGTVEAVARSVEFLIGAEFITGHVLDVDGGRMAGC
jgi:pteridine reductase